MKTFIALILLPVLFTPAFATNVEDTTELETPKIQTVQNGEAKEAVQTEDKSEYFDTLRKSNSISKNTLGLGENKQNSLTKDAEICSVASETSDGKSGAGLCGVPAAKSGEESKDEASDEPS